MEKPKDQVTNKTSIPPRTKKLKITQEEYLATVEIKSIERDCLERVFNMLSELQEQPSSDDDSPQKKFKREIEIKANEKKMKLKFSNINTGRKIENIPNKSKIVLKNEKNFKEDAEDTKTEQDKGGIGLKGIRKILRTLCNEYPKEEMEMMIWEVDENLDNMVSHDEMYNMYKRCVTDAMETEPKKLYYLIQFLMYDKERKGFITEEDTLEILYIRNEKNFNEAIDAIFE